MMVSIMRKRIEVLKRIFQKRENNIFTVGILYGISIGILVGVLIVYIAYLCFQ